MGIRIGIVGAGTTVAIADRHVEGFLAQAGRCTVTAVCSRTLEGCRRLCIRHGLDGVRMTTRLEELLDVVDAVVLCTPNQFHLPYTERAVERGKAVLLEKPLGLQTAPPGQAERLLARRDARVMVAYVYRYTAVVERLRALLRQRMGRVYLAQASQGGTRLADPAVPLEWRMRRSASGSGALGDFGSHLLDLLQYAAGVELAEAAGYGGTFLPTRRPDGQGNTCVENDDAFVFCGRGTGGALCSVSVSRVGLDGIHLCISGEGGLLRASVEEGVLTYWPKAPDGPYAPEGEARSEHLAEPPGLRFARQAAAFLDLVEGRPVEYCTLEQAVHLFEHALLDTARQPLVTARAQRGAIPGDAQAQHVVARALLRGQGITVVQLFQRAHHAVAVLGIDGIAGRGGLQHGAELRGGQPFQLAAIG